MTTSSHTCLLGHYCERATAVLIFNCISRPVQGKHARTESVSKERINEDVNYIRTKTFDIQNNADEGKFVDIGPSNMRLGSRRMHALKVDIRIQRFEHEPWKFEKVILDHFSPYHSTKRELSKP